VNKTIEMGIADSAKLGIWGMSYGGYSTISAVTQTTRFKAAVMEAGVGDIISMYGQLNDNGVPRSHGWAESSQGLMGGTLWEQRDRYIENSPIFYLDRVTTPVLILHGEQDDNVRHWQSDEVYAGLLRLGKEVEYRLYPGERHAIAGDANVLDYWQSIIRWFDTYIKGQSQQSLSRAAKPEPK
jgi:dipeptidyl aminopeptidase/acylaminoacyl peptidase